MDKKVKKFFAGNLVLTMVLSNVVVPVAAVDENPNYSLQASASGENTEGQGNTYDKAIDGDYASCLASSKDTKPVLVLDLKEEKEVNFIRLFLEERKNTTKKNNVRRYRITFSTDQDFSTKNGSLERILDENTCRDDVILTKTLMARYVKLEVLETHRDSWDNAGICEFELYQKPLNLSLNGTASGTDNEGAGNTYDKVINGNYETRLASSQNKKPMLDIDLKHEENVGYLRLFAKNRKNTPINNIQEYKVTVSQGDTKNKFASAAEFSFFKPIKDTDKKVDKTALGQVIARAQNLHKDEYTTSSYNQELLTEVLTEAIIVYNNNNVGEDDIEIAMQGLQNFLDKLAKRGDITEIVALANEYTTLNEADYTVASWKEYRKALDVVNNVIADNSNVSQEMIDQAKVTLTKVKKALVKNDTTSNNKDLLEVAVDVAQMITD